ncbi:Semaphorin-4B Semaphorin-C [Channa argus]|uniref:Semaphorin-4B Semaphorin-C n=1 Tax=Channa argus TaxID=215402 RepID=A0A6G1PQ48_CHAAH|nr:Semaphorin-4B Semaphorin-C [Channa argus]
MLHLSILISSIMAPPVVVFLLGLLSSANSLPPPRTSFLLNSADRPLIHFSPPNVYNTTTLLLSDDGSTLYVGARDAVLSLDVSQSDVISMKRKVEWGPSQEDTNNCRSKGKNPQVDCPNFVSVLQPINSTHLYACGSYAYSPHDAYIDAESFVILQREGAKGRCPFSPFQRNTAITIDGELFTATTTDFRGIKPQISRHFSKDGRPDINQDSVSLLEEPVFIRSSFDPTERKLYFFFTEVGKEFSYVDELRVSRVAQVCKDDVGGQRTLQKKWTSFAKAPLLCQSLRRLPFNILHDVFTLAPQENGNTSETLFYGVFTSQWSSRPESAVCVFNLQDIRTSFTENYRTFDMQQHQWNKQERHSYLGKCGLDSATDAELAEVKRNFLTSRSVNPVGNRPLLVSSDQRYTRVAAMRTKAADGKLYTVLFLLTESGFLHKVVLLNGGARVIEEFQVFTQTQQVKSIILSSSKGVLYLGTAEGVTAVPVAKCSLYRSCSQCVLARDPLCGWSPTQQTCTSVSNSTETLAQDLDNGNVAENCPRQTRSRLHTEVTVNLYEAVKLQCVKTSNLATLTWTSPQFNNDQGKLFIQSADNSLSFFATNDTLGTYFCKAEEEGYTEVVASYVVQQRFSPRSKNPHHVTNDYDVPNDQDEPYEDIQTEEPVTTSEALIDGPAEDSEHKQVTFSLTHKPDIVKQPSSSKTSIQDITFKTNVQSRMTLPCEEKSYYSEVIVISLLLVICICFLVLGGLYMWWPSQTGCKGKLLVCPEDDSKENKSMETVPSLSSPEDAVPEVMVVQK